MRRQITALILISVLFFSAPVSADEKENLILYQEAQQLMDRWTGDPSVLKAVRRLLDKILAADPDSALAQVGLGRLAYKTGYKKGSWFDRSALEEARAHFNRAVQLDPGLYDVYYYGTFAFMFSQDLKTARAWTEEAKKIEPDSARTALLLAELALREKNYDQAGRLAETVLSKTENIKILSDTHTLLTKVYLRTKDYDRAEDSYLKNIELTPRSPWALSNYASFLTNYRADYDQAIKYAGLALKQMEFGMGRRVLGKAWSEKGFKLLDEEKKTREAMTCFQKALDNNPRNAEALYGLGSCHFRLGKQEQDPGQLIQARDELLEAIRIDPGLTGKARLTLIEVEKTRRPTLELPDPDGSEARIKDALREFAAAQKIYRKEYGQYALYPEQLVGWGKVGHETGLAVDPLLPYKGYYFFGLKKQAHGEINLSTGFVFTAIPVQYGLSGRYTYVIGPTAEVFRKDIGAEPISNAARIDSSWQAVE